MRAIDTNVVVRALTGDHLEQAGRARALIQREPVLVMTTVLIEVYWVLRSSFGLSRKDVGYALRGLTGLPTVQLQDPDLVAKALDWLEDGLDFADALHLAGAADCAGFVTFDKRLVRIAEGRVPIPVGEPEAA